MNPMTATKADCTYPSCGCAVSVPLLRFSPDTMCPKIDKQRQRPASAEYDAVWYEEPGEIQKPVILPGGRREGKTLATRRSTTRQTLWQQQSTELFHAQDLDREAEGLAEKLRQ